VEEDGGGAGGGARRSRRRMGTAAARVEENGGAGRQPSDVLSLQREKWLSPWSPLIFIGGPFSGAGDITTHP